MQLLHRGALILIISTGYGSGGNPSPCQMVSGDKGTKITQFNMFRFVIHKKRGYNNCILFSQLKFKNKNGVVFQYSSNDYNINTLRNEVGLSKTTGTWGDNNSEDGLHGLMETGDKCCVVDANVPYGSEPEVNFCLTYELNKNGLYSNPLLDVSIYNKVSFYTANDSLERTPYIFSFDVRNKNDETGWLRLIDHAVGKNVLYYKTIEYEGTLNTDILK